MGCVERRMVLMDDQVPRVAVCSGVLESLRLALDLLLVKIPIMDVIHF